MTTAARTAPPHGDVTPRRRWAAACAALTCVLWTAAVAAAIDHDALWKIVHGLCVVDKMHLHSAAPCAVVDLKDGEDNGYAVLKDIIGRTQFLLIPTRRLSGIEDPLIGTDAVPNYWAAAWSARKLVAANTGQALPVEDVGMAINGMGARTQDQLHIHVDCVQPKVRAALQGRIDEIGAKWGDFALLGHDYRARRIVGDEPTPDPFRLLAEDQALAPKSEDSLAVIGVLLKSGEPGFVLLAQRAPNGRTHPENLLDHSCAVATEKLSSDKPQDAQKVTP